MWTTGVQGCAMRPWMRSTIARVLFQPATPNAHPAEPTARPHAAARSISGASAAISIML
jgi:hypothetical protein